MHPNRSLSLLHQAILTEHTWKGKNCDENKHKGLWKEKYDQITDHKAVDCQFGAEHAELIDQDIHIVRMQKQEIVIWLRLICLYHEDRHCANFVSRLQTLNYRVRSTALKHICCYFRKLILIFNYWTVLFRILALVALIFEIVYHKGLNFNTRF